MHCVSFFKGVGRFTTLDETGVVVTFKDEEGHSEVDVHMTRTELESVGEAIFQYLQKSAAEHLKVEDEEEDKKEALQ